MSIKEKLLKLKNDCYKCEECPLGRKQVDNLDPHVFSSGFIKSKVFFIAEAPGFEETKIKKPLVGRSGKFFESKILEVAGIKRSDIFITNAVLCRPSDKNRTPFPVEIDICSGMYLDSQICILEPKLLIPMGNVSLYSCCNTTGIVKQRGRLRWSKEWSNGKSIPVFPIFHPAYCLRGSGLEEMLKDATKIGELYRILHGGGEIEVQE